MDYEEACDLMHSLHEESPSANLCLVKVGDLYEVGVMGDDDSIIWIQFSAPKDEAS